MAIRLFFSKSFLLLRFPSFPRNFFFPSVLIGFDSCCGCPVSLVLFLAQLFIHHFFYLHPLFLCRLSQLLYRWPPLTVDWFPILILNQTFSSYLLSCLVTFLLPFFLFFSSLSISFSFETYEG